MKSKHGSKRYKLIGISLSVAWVSLVLIYIGATKQNPFCLKLNEFGDFFAGAFGPIGILWIVLGFWQQGDELRNSVDALNVQSEELRKSVEQQKALVDTSREQADAKKRVAENLERDEVLSQFPRFNMFSDTAEFNSPHGPSSSAFRLYNSGKICMDIQIWDEDNDPVLLHDKPSLENEKALRFFVEYTDTDHSDFRIIVRFKSSEGIAGHQSFRLRKINDSKSTFAFNIFPERIEIAEVKPQ